MTHKTHPYSNRLTIIRGWKSRWFSNKNYSEQAQQDFLIREFIFGNFINAGVADIEIERFANSLSVIIFTSRPGIIIGRAGIGADQLKKDLYKLLNKKVKFTANEQRKNYSLPEIRVEVKEIRDADTNARLVALNVAEQLERRIPFRRVIKRALDRVMANKKVEGVKISVAGRLNGSDMARIEFVKEGNLPLQTLRADVDYAYVKAVTKYGVIGIKVWIYKGEKLE
ncbi:MAG: 30S ribosomal protein S3 [Candidatus Spechtbacteria bacterium RIFCSPLOWO2_02_FULL_38_8]|uniref:Small ribosomal subunit protein uS3 n=1 Tax=Candidatus Spechtbacteria bacterium RIFCSPLOWO2_02_FULL_38_8 TaxID=1802164 RepID=A0A1G2HGF9_9BACT|nr:MAG: 30S ribosomal protein S3 [Candidatus Spechtbacteria bacterium RIFCSPLOWO2_02_FULL_38_8]